LIRRLRSDQRGARSKPSDEKLREKKAKEHGKGREGRT